MRKRKIVLLSIAAVAVSTALLIVVCSLFIGFIEAFESAAVLATGDVVLAPPIKFAGYGEFIERLEQLETVEAATATLSSQGLLYLGKGNVREVRIWGIDPASRAKVTGFKQDLLKQKSKSEEPSFEVGDLQGPSPKMSGFVGIGVVAEPDERTDKYDFGTIENDLVGRKVVLITGVAASQAPSEEMKFKRKNIPFTISDIVFTGVYFLDKNFVYLPIGELHKKLYGDEQLPAADQIQIKLAGGAGIDAALAQIRQVWDTFASERLGWSAPMIKYTEVETSKQMQRQYIAALWQQMWMLLLIFGVVSFGVVLLVFCIFYMIVTTKQKDIAILKSCGATSGSVTSIFVGFGGCAGIIGSAVGTALGYVVTRNINTIEEWIRIIFGLKLWKSSIYMFSRIPNQIYWGPTLLVVLSAVAAVSVGALIPAVLAAWTRPVNILRYE
jgi:lipoprotein-releasing system permease protein